MEEVSFSCIMGFSLLTIWRETAKGGEMGYHGTWVLANEEVPCTTDHGLVSLGGGGVTKVKAEAGVLYGKCPSNGGPCHRL